MFGGDHECSRLWINARPLVHGEEHLLSNRTMASSVWMPVVVHPIGLFTSRKGLLQRRQSVYELDSLLIQEPLAPAPKLLLAREQEIVFLRHVCLGFPDSRLEDELRRGDEYDQELDFIAIATRLHEHERLQADSRPLGYARVPW